jgi:hypothetical protein
LIRNQFPPESFTALAPSFIQYNQTSLEGERRGEERRGEERRGEKRRGEKRREEERRGEERRGEEWRGEERRERITRLLLLFILT